MIFTYIYIYISTFILCSLDLVTNPPDDLDCLINEYNLQLRILLDQHAPLITKAITIRPYNSWYDDDVKLAMAERKRAARKFEKMDRKDYNKLSKYHH